MFVAIVDFYVAPESRSTALDTLLSGKDAIRAMEGKMTYRPHTDPTDDTHVGIVQEWSGEAAFNAYLASPEFGGLKETLFPLMTAPPSSRLYNAEAVES
jgi:quinol monooxygenase YgiN